MHGVKNQCLRCRKKNVSQQQPHLGQRPSPMCRRILQKNSYFAKKPANRSVWLSQSLLFAKSTTFHSRACIQTRDSFLCTRVWDLLPWANALVRSATQKYKQCILIQNSRCCARCATPKR